MRHLKRVCFPKCFPIAKMMGKQVMSPEWLKTQSRRGFTTKSRCWNMTQNSNNRHSIRYGNGL